MGYVKVTLNGETDYYTERGYEELRLTFSTGDFHTHQAVRVKRLPEMRYAITENDVNPRLKYPTVESIIEAYNETGRWAYEYNTENTDCPAAEFAATFGYGECDISEVISRLPDDIAAAVKDMSRRPLFELLGAHSECRCVDIYLKDGEVYSVSLGEMEEQPDDTLIAAFLTLTPPERDQVRRAVSEGYVSESGWIYINCDYRRWAVIVDEDSLREALKINGGSNE